MSRATLAVCVCAGCEQRCDTLYKVPHSYADGNKNLKRARGLKARRPRVGLLVPAVAAYGNLVPHAIFPSSDDNSSETHVRTTPPPLESVHATVG